MALNLGQIFNDLNHTYITLIPKEKHPQFVGDYHLISLHNVLYKLISKAIANRQKGVLPLLISESQTTFVLDRQITDNILMAYKVVHFLKRKNIGK